MSMLRYIACFFLFIPFLQSQDLEFSQFYAAPLYLNPAMAGINNPRIILNYRNQWPNLQNAYITYAASYDQYFEPLHGGAGLLVLTDRAGNGVYKATSVAACYSYHFQPAKKYAVAIGLQPSFTQRSVDWNSLTFSDMIDSRYGFRDANGVTNPTIQPGPGSTSVNYLDVSSGIFLYSAKLYAGLGVKHLLFPDEAFEGNWESTVPLRFAIHGGSIIYTGKNPKAKAYFSPNLMLINQAKFNQLNIGAYIGRESLFGGLWLRHTFSNADALIFLIGLSKKNFKVGYSYDATLSALTSRTGGAHEISLTFDLSAITNAGGQNGKGSRGKIIECPEIF